MVNKICHKMLINIIFFKLTLYIAFFISQVNGGKRRESKIFVMVVWDKVVRLSAVPLWLPYRPDNAMPFTL